MIGRSQSSSDTLQIINILIIIISILVCSILMLVRLPGMELIGIGPNWILIWMVTWSIKRNVWQSLIAGISLGLIQDGMTSAYPSHILGFVLVGVIVAQLQKQSFIQEDFISVALIVFVMVIVSETVLALQYFLHEVRQVSAIWSNYQRITITSAIISSLWSPIIYLPLNLWWQKLKKLPQF